MYKKKIFLLKNKQIKKLVLYRTFENIFYNKSNVNNRFAVT